jgi:hypothetical protein
MDSVSLDKADCSLECDRRVADTYGASIFVALHFHETLFSMSSLNSVFCSPIDVGQPLVSCFNVGRQLVTPRCVSEICWCHVDVTHSALSSLKGKTTNHHAPTPLQCYVQP